MSELPQPYPATVMVHWPGQSTPMCDRHRDASDRIANAMGMPPVTATPLGGQAECSNCIREAEKASKERGKS